MIINVINASHWQWVDEGDTLYYFNGYPLARGQSCRHVYYPFAWIRIHKQTNQILAARDHFGQEPFYYTYQDQCIIFGSTLPDILKYLPQKPKITPHLVRDCFTRSLVDDPPYSKETYYEGIFRITPAHYLHIHGMAVHEEPFWQLALDAPVLHYADEREYVAHFSMLLDESIRVTTAHAPRLAMEFSGGMDSTSLFVACRKAKLEPALFTHIPPQTRKPTHEDMNVSAIIKQFNWADNHYSVDAEHFDPMSVFQRFAQLFASPPPDMNCVLSNNLHRVVVEKGYNTLISGYGGDDGASFFFPPQIMYHQRWREQGFHQVWRDWSQVNAPFNLKPVQQLGCFLELLSYANPKCHELFHVLKTIKHRLMQRIQYKKNRVNVQSPPLYHSLREYEYDVIQGALCHEMRMRLEYSAVAAKAMELTYIYPLLYPPLIEFCFSLPLEQKFKLGRMRCTMRDYLSQHVDGMKFGTKSGSAVPSTMQKCRDYYQQGKFSPYFTQLPFQSHIDAAYSADNALLLKIHAWMVKAQVCTADYSDFDIQAIDRLPLFID